MRVDAIAEAEQQFGPVDAMVNNAGVMLLGNIDSQNPDEWEQMIDISSIAGRKTFPNHVVYVGTKFAVHGLSENLREELSPHNVRVVVIAPGAVETELLSHTTSDDIKAGYQSWKQDMGGKVLSPEDVAHAIEYAYSQPQYVCIREIVLAATRQGA